MIGGAQGNRMDRRNFFAKTLAAGAALGVAKLQGDRQWLNPANPLCSPADLMAAMPLAPQAEILREQPEPISGTNFTLQIGPTLVKLARKFAASTTGYNGTSPGPLLRMREGVPVAVNVFNDTDVPEFVHWHGLLLAADADGAAEEGTPPVPPHGSRRYTFVPRPAGTRWYHTQVSAGMDLSRGLYTGQFGFVYVEPQSELGRYDQELFLALHEWQPFYQNNAKSTPQAQASRGLDVGYRIFSINDHALYGGEPIRVRQGQRVLFHLLNASATEYRRLALPGHRFQVTALDGNPVPQPQPVHAIELGPGERVDAIVEMNEPGVWILGSSRDDDRKNGLGVVVAYDGHGGPPTWLPPPDSHWDYGLFGLPAPRPAPDETIRLVFGQVAALSAGSFSRWTINGKSFPQTDPLRVRAGVRYRLVMHNQTDEPQTMHLHRHLFELTRVAGIATSGIMKDTVVVPALGEVAVDFLADQPGPALLRCQQQNHGDFGLMALLEYD
jgi:FtsP/CotA-like multicopper oxidase with cupredoxin domain